MGLDNYILVIRRKTLFNGNYSNFQGFLPHKKEDYESRILSPSNSEYRLRRSVEEDPLWKQPIPYILIVNPKLKRVFAYQRSKEDPFYTEKRLQGKWSWGIGGHIERSDIKTKNPLREGMFRELREEVFIKGGISEPKVLGYINDDSDNVGKVHFGILYLIETDATEIKPRDREIVNGRLRTIKELEKICSSDDVETWSKIALDPLKKIIS